MQFEIGEQVIQLPVPDHRIEIRAQRLARLAGRWPLMLHARIREAGVSLGFAPVSMPLSISNRLACGYIWDQAGPRYGPDHPGHWCETRNPASYQRPGLNLDRAVASRSMPTCAPRIRTFSRWVMPLKLDFVTGEPALVPLAPATGRGGSRLTICWGRVRRVREAYGFRFADVVLAFPVCDGMELEVKLLRGCSPY